MKNKKIIYTLAFFAITAILGACVKEDYTYPPQKIYTVDFDTNATISELLALYPGFQTQIDTDLVVCGTVISDDSKGNFYQKLIVQDSTGGIDIEIDESDLFVKYPLGTKVYVKCKDLVLLDYRGVKQLKYLSNGTAQKIPSLALPKIVYRVEGGIPIIPKKIKIADLNKTQTNTLIQIENVQFIAGDTAKNYAEPTAVANRTIEDFLQNHAIVRTSNYATFSQEHLPKGNGSIIGVYGVFETGTTYDKQLFIRDTTDIVMNNKRIRTVIAETFTTNLGSFTQFSVAGSKTWAWSNAGSNGANQYIVMNGYNNGANEDWLISPSIDISEVTQAVLSFNHAINFYSNPVVLSDMTLWISTNYSGTGTPAEASWTQLSDFIYPAGNNWNWYDSGSIDLSGFIGNNNVHFAFKYTCASSGAGAWEINSATVTVQ